MPEDFDRCSKNPKSKIRTISGPNKKWGVPSGKYRHICYLPNGKTYKGYLKVKKSTRGRRH